MRQTCARNIGGHMTIIRRLFGPLAQRGLLMGFFISDAYAQTGGGPAGPGMGDFMFLIIIFAVFWFLLIRPQQKQQRKHQELLGQLKKNDEVVTSGGIHGTIVNVDEQTVTLRVDDNTRIKFQKSTISHVKKKSEK